MKFNEEKAKQYLIDLIKGSTITPSSVIAESNVRHQESYIDIQLHGQSKAVPLFQIIMNGPTVITDFGKKVFDEQT